VIAWAVLAVVVLVVFAAGLLAAFAMGRAAGKPTPPVPPGGVGPEEDEDLPKGWEGTDD